MRQKYQLASALFLFIITMAGTFIYDLTPLLTVIEALLICILAFCTGLLQRSPGKKQMLILLALSVVGMGLSDKLFLSGLLLFSLLLWGAITPAIIKYKRALTAAVTLAALLIFLTCLTKFSLPLLPLVFYPLYLYGYLICDHTTGATRKEGLFLAVRLVFATVVFLLPYRFTSNTSYIGGLCFVKNPPSGVTAAMQFTIVALAFLYLAFQICTVFNYIRQIKFVATDGCRNENLINAKEGFASIFSVFSLVSALYIFSEWLIRGDLLQAVKTLLSAKAVFNILFYASLCFVLMSLLGRVWVSILSIVFSSVLILANYIKLTYFNEPFYPWDISIIKNVLMIGGHYITPPVVVLSAFLIACFVFVHRQCHETIRKALRPKPLFIMLPFSIALLLSNVYILYQPNLLKEMQIQKSWYIGREEMAANGFYVQNAMYLRDIEEYLPSAPKGYTKESMQDILSLLSSVKSTDMAETEKPNIVIVMDESFWNPTKLGVTFNKDITKTLRTYQSGELISPVFGAKTANTEFEVLTGLSMYFLEPSMIPYNLYLRRSTPSIVSALRDCGYETIAIHPNDGSFYNRSSVYKNIGFDRFIDISGFEADTDSGYYVTDGEVADKILEILGEDSGKPKFIFALTIENHDPYYSRYEKAPVQVQTDLLDDTQKRILNNYAMGVYSGDRTLEKLIHSLKNDKAHTNLYFYGDHLPRLGSPNGIYDVYETLGFISNKDNIELDEKLYTVPLVTWSNYKELEKQDKPISPAQLGYQVLRDAEVSYPAYFDILGMLRDHYSVLQRIIDGQAAIADELVEKYGSIQYDLLFGKQYLLSLRPN